MSLLLSNVRIEECKSTFIGYLYKFEVGELTTILSDLKKEYKNARHFPYAYIVDQECKAFDDGEPHNTASSSILYCLKMKNLTSHLIVVVRFFGGVKLGASRLTKTFRKTASLLVNELRLKDD
jgi:putative IMPACT (imprinted ancient) family translation regulator